MSLDHEEHMIDKFSAISKASNVEKQTEQENELKLLLESKQQLMMKQSEDYLSSLFERNATTPITIKNAQITNSQSFRYSFLQKQFQPLLAKNLLTLQDFFTRIDQVNENLTKLNIIENSLISIQKLPPKLWSQKQLNEVVPIFNIIPLKKFYAKTGTNIGNGEGDGYIQFQLKNLFGGAENLIFDAITGTKTQSSYLINYNQPIFNNANYIIENLAYINTRKLDWNGIDVTTRGISNKIYTQYSGSVNHDLIFENNWRSLINYNSKSIDVLNQLGDNFKSSLIYNWRFDSRDNKVMPTRGKLIRFGLEYSGFWKFNSDNFIKFIYESQFSYKLNKNNSIILSNKSGLLYSLAKDSNILDRFYIGGPTDVRSFLINGLGPKNFNSSIGGDYFLNGGISLITNIPKYNDSNFKIHQFVNFGKLLPLDKSKSTKKLIKDLCTQHSISYGFGILYNHPMARFELNFVLPLAVHERDYIRKGFQYGIGIAFL